MQRLAKQRCMLRKDQEEVQFQQNFALCVICQRNTSKQKRSQSTHHCYGCHTGTKLRHRCISLTDIAVNLGEHMSAALHAICVFSGCDTTSAFAGNIKTKIFRLASQNDCLRLAMTRVGCSLAQTKCEKFVYHLYGLPTSTSVNEVRYEIFRIKCSKGQQMPPTQDALRQHVLRVNYQSFV